MKPIEFDGVNCVYAKDQPEYLPLPVRRSDDGKVLSCWRMNWWERVAVLLTGCVWLELWTFNNPLQPQRLMVRRNDEYAVQRMGFWYEYLRLSGHGRVQAAWKAVGCKINNACYLGPKRWAWKWKDREKEAGR